MKKNTRMGKNMKDAYNFIRKVNGWHSFAKDNSTKSAIKKLEKMGLVEINEFDQFRLNPKVPRPASNKV